ncbi:MAG: choice-of-anchor U domain-containing protein [Dehalococcoidia bacterium]
MPFHKRLLSLTILVILLSVAFPLITMPSTAEAAYTWTAMTSGTTENLYSVWGSSGGDVFAVGTNGTVLHYNGSTWTAMTSGTTQTLRGVWGSSGSDVFAVGANGTVLHYNGSTWTTMTSNTSLDLYGVWGNSSNSVFAVGTAETILYWNGSTWTAMTTPGQEVALLAVWGTSYNDVYAVSSNGVVLHWNGTAWTQSNVTYDSLYAVWGTSSSNVYAADASGTLWHYNGSTWSSTILSSASLTGLWGTSADDIFVAGNNYIILHYDGSAWTAMTSGTTPDLNSIWGQCSSSVFAVGSDGTILHYGSGCGSRAASVGTDLGTVNFTVDYGSISNLTRVRVADTRCSTPSGYDFSYGLFSFKISDLTAGQTVKVSIKFPRRIPTDVKYYKCTGSQLVDCTTRIMTRLNDYTLMLSLTDGGLCDADGLANGTIIDPGGPAEPVAAAQVYGQGTMSTTITQQAPVALPDITVKSASLSATKVTPGTPVTVTADVVNAGTSNGSSNIKVYVNGEVATNQGVTVTSGSSVPLTFTISCNKPGTYTVYVEGKLAGSLKVDWLTDSTILIIGGAVILFAFAIGVIYVTRRKQSH